MKKLLIRLGLLVIAVIATITLRVFVTIKLNFNNFPENNVSNSKCFRAKLDHAIRTKNFKACSLLIAGSSISLNDISGKTIQNKTNEIVYNISSWDEKPQQTVELFKSNVIGHKIKYLLIAFNNSDFGNIHYNIDYSESNSFVNGNLYDRFWIFFKTFNFTTFFHDLDYRTHFSQRENNYASLDFDETGTAELNRNGFIINEKRWKIYIDTTGFSIFYNSICQLYSLCKKNNIELILAYLPTRSDLLSENNKRENLIVAKRLKAKFKFNFIDLNNVKLDSYDFCDGMHFFKEGAEYITHLLLDSLQVDDKRIFLTKNTPNKHFSNKL